jgi:hypothetical protein
VRVLTDLDGGAEDDGIRLRRKVVDASMLEELQITADDGTLRRDVDDDLAPRRAVLEDRRRGDLDRRLDLGAQPMIEVVLE